MPTLVLHKHQQEVMASTARFIGCISGIRGGKTTIGAIWLLNQINVDRESGKLGDYLICAPTNKILDQSTVPKFKEFFPSDWGTWKEQKSCFELNWNRTGTTEPCRIYVRSMDEPDSIEGMDCLAAWMDEAGKMKSQAWINVQGRLSVQKGRCIITSTPYASNWFFRDFYKKKDDVDFCIITWASTDNPVFPKDEFERMKKALPKAIFERRYLGKFTRLEGLVYPEFDEDTHVVDPFVIPKGWLKFGGLDFGRRDPNAVECIAKDPDSNTFYVFSEFYRNETLLRVISEFLETSELSYVLADAHDSQLIAELNQYYGNKNIKEADKTIDVGIERIRSLLIEERIKFFRGKCPHLIEEIQEYHYSESNDDKVSRDKPVSKNDHALDALRYAFSRPLQGLYAARVSRVVKQRFSRRATISDSITGY